MRRGFFFPEGRAIDAHDEHAGGGDALASVTHARLRAGQGDVAGARAVLAVLLRREPRDAHARALLEALEGAPGTGHVEPGDEPAAPPSPADAASLRGEFRAALTSRAAHDAPGRLRRWAETISRNRGERRDAR